MTIEVQILFFASSVLSEIFERINSIIKQIYTYKSVPFEIAVDEAKTNFTIEMVNKLGREIKQKLKIVLFFSE